MFSFIPSLDAQQSTFAKIYNYSYQVQAYSVVKTFDNAYMIAGEESNEALVFKIDTSGNIIWKKKLGSNNNECFRSLIATRDSCYVMAGNILNVVDSVSDFLCVKINSNGDTIWTKEINLGYSDSALSVQQTSDNGYIIAGCSSQSSTPHSLLAVVKLDSNGNLMWGNTISIANFNSYVNAVKQTPDNGYVLIGYIDSISIWGTFLMKLDTAGNISWTKKQMGSSNYAFGLDVNFTTDGMMCYLESSSHQCAIMKTDLSGYIVWSKKYNMGIFDYCNPSFKLYKISDNEFIFNSGNALTKVDTAGIPLWTKNSQPHSINDFIQNQDKGFLIIGNPGMITKSFGVINILKTDSLGHIANSYCPLGNGVPSYTSFPISLTSVLAISAPTALTVMAHPVVANSLLTLYGNGCVIGNIEESKADKSDLQVFPIPASDNLTIETSLKAKIEISNIQGQLIKRINTTENQTTIDISCYASGIYFVKMISDKEIITKKFIKE